MYLKFLYLLSNTSHLNNSQDLEAWTLQPIWLHHQPVRLCCIQMRSQIIFARSPNWLLEPLIKKNGKKPRQVQFKIVCYQLKPEFHLEICYQLDKTYLVILLASRREVLKDWLTFWIKLELLLKKISGFNQHRNHLVTKSFNIKQALAS